MKVRNQAIEELGLMNPSEILKVYNLILSLKKNSHDNRRLKIKTRAYQRTREALKNCKGSLAEDILQERKERI